MDGSWKCQANTNTHVVVNKVHIIKCRGYKVKKVICLLSKVIKKHGDI